MKDRMAAVESGSCAARPPTSAASIHSVGSGGTDASTIPPPNIRLPMGMRKTLCIGGWIYSEGAELASEMREVLRFAHIQGVAKVFPAGSYTDRVKVEFTNKDFMWKCLVAMKGKKFTSSLAERSREVDQVDGNKRKLWHSIDKYTDEI
eukprot:5620405-Pyramimonas_sp.AAC.1